MAGTGSQKIDSDKSQDRPSARITPIIEVHGWEHPDSENDITDFTKAAQWEHSVKAPFGTARVELAFPADMFEHFKYADFATEGEREYRKNRDTYTPYRIAKSMPFPGDFLVIREPSNKRAMWWGPIDNVEFNHVVEEGGLVKTAFFEITAINWMHKLNDLHITTALGLRENRDYGGLLNGDRIADFLDILETTAGPDPADGLTRMWEFVRGYRIPPSLGGAPNYPIGPTQLPNIALLCHQIPVVGNRARAAAFARGRIVEPVPGMGILNSIGAFQTVVGSETSVAQLMKSTFDINADLVEMFPSLEYPGDSPRLRGAEIGGDDSFRKPLVFNDKDSLSDPIEYEETPRDFQEGVTPKSFFDRLPFPYAPPEDSFTDPDKANFLNLILNEQKLTGKSIDDPTFAAGFADRMLGAKLTDLNELATKGPTGVLAEKLSWVQDLGSTFVSPMAHKLRANPVIIYRMTPLRSLGINAIVKDARDPGEFNTNIFGHDDITWYTDATKSEMTPDLKHRGKFRDPHFFIQADEVLSISAVRDDTHRHNAFTIDVAMGGLSALRYWSDAGLPFFDLESVRRYGAKVMTVEWPFLPKKEKNEHHGAVLRYMRTVCAHAFHCYIRRRDQMSGTIEMAYRPDIMHGEPISVELDKSHTQSFSNHFEFSRPVVPPHLGYPSANPVSRPPNNKFKAPQSIVSKVKAKAAEIADSASKPFEKIKNAATQTEKVKNDPTEPSRLSAYVEGVRHSVTVDETGAIKFRTSLDYNFGVFDPTSRLNRIMEIANE